MRFTSFTEPRLSPLPSKIKGADNLPNMRRLFVIFGILVAGMCTITGRLWYLQIVQNDEYINQSISSRTRVIRQIAPRGLILDSKGNILANNIRSYHVAVAPKEFRDHPEALAKIAKILNISESQINETLKAKRGIEIVRIAENVDLTALTQIEEQRLDLQGIEILRDAKREYTNNRAYSHILGRVRRIDTTKLQELNATSPQKPYHEDDIIGTTGLERYYEQELHGTNGGIQIEVDSKNRMRKRLEELPTTPGNTLKLALEPELQQIAYDALQSQLAYGRPGAVVALDPNTGAVLASVSTPSYDLNTYSQDIAKLSTHPLRPEVNRVLAPGPIGSTFKMVTAAAGLSSEKIFTSTYVYCPGYITVAKRRFKCDATHGSCGFHRSLGASCNVYYYTTGRKTGIQNMEATMRRFGLGELTGIDIPFEKRGTIPSPEWKQQNPKRGRWVPGDLVNMSIGQGYMQASLIQLVDYAAAIGNGGTLWKPQLVKEIIDPSGKVIHKLKPTKRGDLGLLESHRQAIVQGMRMCLYPGGTAGRVGRYGLDVAGKTGTVQVKGKRDFSYFVCFAPASNPKIAVAAMVERGGFGAHAAAPIAMGVVSKYLQPKSGSTRPPQSRRDYSRRKRRW